MESCIVNLCFFALCLPQSFSRHALTYDNPPILLLLLPQLLDTCHNTPAPTPAPRTIKQTCYPSSDSWPYSFPHQPLRLHCSLETTHGILPNHLCQFLPMKPVTTNTAIHLELPAVTVPPNTGNTTTSLATTTCGTTTISTPTNDSY